MLRTKVMVSNDALYGADFTVPLDHKAHEVRTLEWRWNADGSQTVFIESGGMISAVTNRKGVLRGTFFSDDHSRFELLHREGEYWLEKQAGAEFSCLTALPVTADSTAFSKRRSVPSTGKTILRIGLLYSSVYTATVSSDEIALRLQHDVALLTSTLWNTGITWAEFELAGIEKIDSPGGPIDQVLKWAANPENGLVRDLKRRMRAQFVVLFIQDIGNPTVGVAYRSFPGSTNPARGFAVIGGADLVDASYVFVHEVGHLLGGDHNPENVSLANDPLPDARDFYVCGATGWRGALTQSQCSPAVPMLPFFSNPKVMVKGAPAGVSDKQNNARAFGIIIPEAVNY